MTEQAAPLKPTLYESLGGEAGVRSLVDRFYDLMDLEPAYAGIRSMHPPTLDGSRDKLFWFLSGWLGGPPIYAEKIGTRCFVHAIFLFRSAWTSATSGSSA